MQRSMPRPRPRLKLLLACMLVLPLLAGCSLPAALAALFHQNETRMAIGVCPSLPPPPDSVVTALDHLAATDKAASDYEIALAKHYDKLDQCGTASP